MIFSLVARVNDNSTGLGSLAYPKVSSLPPHRLALIRVSQAWFTVYLQFHIAAYAFSVPKADLDIQTLSMMQW